MDNRLILEGGKLAYNLVKDSQTIININNAPFTNAVPKGISIESLSGWEKSVISINEQGVNNLNKLCLDVDIYIEWLHNGNRNNEYGYITNASSYCVINKKSFDWNFDISIVFGNPYNATSELGTESYEVIAGLPFIIDCRAETKLLSFKTSDNLIQWRGTIYGVKGKSGKGISSYERKVIKKW